MNTLKFASAFLMLSDMTADSDKAKLQTKQRIVFATMKHYIPDWEPPKKWDSFSTAKKLDILNNIQETIKEQPKKEQ